MGFDSFCRANFINFFLFFFNKGEKLNEELFVFIFIQIVFGIFLCLPSLVISEIFYKTISKKDLNDNNVFYYTILISLLTTSLTYIIFFGRTDDYSIVFSISYSAILILGFFYFKNSTQNIQKIKISNYKTNNGGLIFCILFSLLLLIGLVIFKNSDNHQLTTDNQNI